MGKTYSISSGVGSGKKAIPLPRLFLNVIISNGVLLHPGWCLNMLEYIYFIMHCVEQLYDYFYQVL